MARHRRKREGAGNVGSWLWGREMCAIRLDPLFRSIATRLGLMRFRITFRAPDDCALEHGEQTRTCFAKRQIARFRMAESSRS
jgi:hypothetical protein